MQRENEEKGKNFIEQWKRKRTKNKRIRNQFFFCFHITLLHQFKNETRIIFLKIISRPVQNKNNILTIRTKTLHEKENENENVRSRKAKAFAIARRSAILDPVRRSEMTIFCLCIELLIKNIFPEMRLQSLCGEPFIVKNWKADNS